MRRAAGAVALFLICATAATGQSAPTARFAEPTLRYDHGVLGDAVEWGALEIDYTGISGTARHRVVIRLPLTRVFEDTAPRVTDLDGDGSPEVVVVESDLQLGASLAIYDIGGLVARTPFIGQRHRWLAPAGIADLDGDGAPELAYIDRPHLVAELVILRFEPGQGGTAAQLIEAARHPGLTNHRIGDRAISGGIARCGTRPALVLASADWRRLMLATHDGQAIRVSDIGGFSPQAMEAALDCR